MITCYVWRMIKFARKQIIVSLHDIINIITIAMLDG